MMVWVSACGYSKKEYPREQHLYKENKPSNMLSNLLLDLLICFRNVLSLYIVTQWSGLLHLLDKWRIQFLENPARKS
jgi:hypothetical protein